MLRLNQDMNELPDPLNIQATDDYFESLAYGEDDC